ncbi:MAG TPA: tail fiber protein [Gaiellaceae bacterium]|nr:tail fiber protein [Gaiellaceae bacterium]
MPSQPYIGDIALVGFNFAPVGWAFCNGALMPISENEALFNLIGTTFGGDGQSTFALPDLRSRVPVHTGTGNGLSPVVIGEMYGVESVTLTVQQLAAHAHTFAPGASSGEPTTNRPDNAYPSSNGYYSSSPTTGVTMPAPTAANSGGSQPHSNIQPVLALNFIIALFGVFPTQN